MIKKFLILLSYSAISFGQNLEKLHKIGFENLQENLALETYTLFFEDNLYRFPADGLFEVLRIIRPIENVKNTKIVLLNKGIPIVEMVFSTNDFVNYKKGSLALEELIVNSSIQFTNEKIESEKSKNPSYFKTDFNLRFTLDYTLGNFDNPIRQRVNFQPMIDIDLSQGVNLQGYYNYPEFNDLGYSEPQVGLLRLSNDFKISKSSYLNTNFGFFTLNRIGITTNYLRFLYEDKLRLNIHSGITRFGRLNKDFILFYDLNTDLKFDFYSELTYRVNKYDMDLTFRYGSYIFGDIGYTAQVRRFSGQRFISLFYKKSNYGTMVGFDFSLPIPIRRYNRKLPVRAKLFDKFYLPYNYRSDSEVGLLYYQGENIVNNMTDFFPEIIRKGLLKALKKGQ